MPAFKNVASENQSQVLRLVLQALHCLSHLPSHQPALFYLVSEETYVPGSAGLLIDSLLSLAAVRSPSHGGGQQGHSWEVV